MKKYTVALALLAAIGLAATATASVRPEHATAPKSDPLAHQTRLADSEDDFGACYQTSPPFVGQTQCNEVERRYCISGLTISTRFVVGDSCPS